MNQENKITLNNLVYALLFLVFGILLLTRATDIIELGSKVLGSVFVIIGIIKCIVYIYMKGKLSEYSLSELIIGLLIISCGILFILYSSALNFAIRIIVGIWALFAGINRIILAISIKNIDRHGFTMFLSTAFVMLIIGAFLISGLFDQLIGLLIIIYSITEIVDYVYYKIKCKDYPSSEIKSERKSSKKVKRLKETKVVDAIVEEDDKK